MAVRTDFGIAYSEEAKRSLWWRLRYAEQVPGFHLYTDGPEVQLASGVEPFFRVYEVRP